MSLSQNPLFESVLALPQAERADLAFLLLESLDPPGEEIDADQFGAELHERLSAYQRGEIVATSLDETRELVRQRLAERRAQ